MIKAPPSLKVSSINNQRASLLFSLGYSVPFIITGFKVNFSERRGKGEKKKWLFKRCLDSHHHILVKGKSCYRQCQIKFFDNEVRNLWSFNIQLSLFSPYEAGGFFEQFKCDFVSSFLKTKRTPCMIYGSVRKFQNSVGLGSQIFTLC